MVKSKIFTFINLFLLLIIIPVTTQAKMSELQSSTVTPIEWQAIKLQESIENKIIRSLNPIIKESDYIIEVKIGTDLDKAEEPSNKKITKTQQKKKVKFSTTEFPKEGDDFVVFNKLGLEAPIIGEEPIETVTSEVELAQKAIIEMNDRYNLFNFLNGIDIKLTFDKGLTTKTRENIQKVIQGLSFNTKDIIPQINIQYLELKDSRVKPDEVKPPAPPAGLAGNKKPEKPIIPKIAWDERFKNLDIMIGMIVASIVLGVVALVISKRGIRHEQFIESKNENKDTTTEELPEEVPEEENLEVPEEENPELIEDGDDMKLDLTKTDPQTLRITEGLERFRKLTSMHYNDMVLLVKGWIKIGRGPEAEALKGLVATLEDAELAEIFKALTIYERNTWKMCLDSEMNRDELAKAFTFVTNKIMEAMMVPALIDDYEICDLLLSITAKDAARFCSDHPELGGIFANVLSSKTISEMFELIPVEMTEDIIERSSMFRKEEIIAQMPLLKEKLLEVKMNRERPPFLARIVDILPTAKPEIERKLYTSLINNCSWEDVKETAINLLPAELVTQLPETVFKAVIGLMPLEAQVHYFAVQEPDQRIANLNKFASKGAKSREMIEIEINAITKNEVVLRKLQNDRRASIEAEFLVLTRNYINSSAEAKLEVKNEVEAWLRAIKNEIPAYTKPVGLNRAA